MMRNHILRQIVRMYCRQMPFHKGKTRLITWAFHHLKPPEEFIRDHLKNGMQVEINPAEWIQNEIYYNGYYEVYLAQFFRKLIAPNWIFADVGAHLGQYSLIAAERGACVYAFEPNPSNFACLQRNVMLNNLPQVVLNPTAVSSRSGESLFELPSSSNTGTGSLTVHLSRSKETVKVKTITLDDYFQSQKTIPNLIKMDVEGAELMALQGAQYILRTHHPLLIIEADKGHAKNFGYTIRQLIDLLGDNDYELYVLKRSILSPVMDMESIESENLICCLSGQSELLLRI